jgi:uncharacterized protein (UPF0261 family)
MKRRSMEQKAAIAVVGTFDSKGEEHLLLKEFIERRGLRALTINVGTGGPSPFEADIDLFTEMDSMPVGRPTGRDGAIQAALELARQRLRELYQRGEICGVISAGGGTGTHLGTGIMKVLPLGVPKVMISTVASRDMAKIVGTKDITMIHSVVDILGVNSILGGVLDRAAAAICAMVQGQWKPQRERKRIALTLFGFVTQAAEGIKQCLEEMGYEVVAFHANGTGGMAMEELAAEGCFHGILDLATHELADELMGGYCSGIGPERLEPIPGQNVPRLVVPGGLDCAVLEFTRNSVPDELRDRKIFFYDFRSAIRLNREETELLADHLAEKLNSYQSFAKVLVPTRGWSEPDREDGPLYDPMISEAFIRRLKKDLNPRIEIKEVDLHINDISFAQYASSLMDAMITENPDPMS